MNVLFFTYDFPYPTTSGGKVRAYNMIKYAQEGMNITLFSFIRSGFDERSIAEMKKIGVNRTEVFPRRKVHNIKNIGALFSGESIFKRLYYDAKVAKRITDVIESEKIDVLHFESFYSAFYLDESYRKMGVKQIYGSENIEHVLYEDYVTHKTPLLLKPGFSLQAKKIKREEDLLATMADVTLAVTETEKVYFAGVTKKPVYVIENGISLNEFSYRPRKNKTEKIILFVGNFSYFPNYDAVMFFYTEVFRHIQDKNLQFSIIGRGSSQFSKFSDPRVQTTEFIPDIKDAYYDADIFVSPIKIGGGTNFKILEAMATGLPVITFSDRMKDIGGKHEEHVLLADDAKDFRVQVERLLHDPKLSERIALNARKIIEEKYSWNRIGKNLNKIWKEL